MDLDLESDLNFENDRIKTFLMDKLQQIQVSNRNVEEMIEKRRGTFSSSDSRNSVMDDDFTKVSFLQKKFFNSKCAFTFEVENNSNLMLKQVKVFFNWDSPILFSYDTYIFRQENSNCSKKCTKITDNVSQGKEIAAKAYIVLIFNTPKFTDKLTYVMKGYILCNQGNRDIVLALPSMEITSSDITTQILNEVGLQSGVVLDLLTVMFCSVKNDFVMILPQGFMSLNSIFEIHCFLTAVSLPESCKKYFTSYKVCPTFDNSIIEIHTLNEQHIFDVTLYTKSDDAVIALIHYLHQNIPGVVMILKSCINNYNIEKIVGKWDVEIEIGRFKTFVEKEVGVVESFKQYLECDRRDCDLCRHLRKKMLDAEKDTDFSYLKIIGNSL